MSAHVLHLSEVWLRRGIALTPSLVSYVLLGGDLSFFLGVPLSCLAGRGLSRTGTPQSLLLYAGLLYYYSCGHIIQAVCMRAVQWLYLCVGLWVDLGRSPRWATWGKWPLRYYQSFIPPKREEAHSHSSCC